MPTLSRKDPHQCTLCGYKSVRSMLKDHLTLAGKKGPRCSGLKKVIPSDIWVNDIRPYYTKNEPLPDLSKFKSGKVGPPWSPFLSSAKRTQRRQMGSRKSEKSRISKNGLEYPQTMI